MTWERVYRMAPRKAVPGPANGALLHLSDWDAPVAGCCMTVGLRRSTRRSAGMTARRSRAGSAMRHSMRRSDDRSSAISKGCNAGALAHHCAHAFLRCRSGGAIGGELCRGGQAHRRGHVVPAFGELESATEKLEPAT